MSYCKKCGYKSNNNGNFCMNCGNSLEQQKVVNKKILKLIYVVFFLLFAILFSINYINNLQPKNDKQINYEKKFKIKENFTSETLAEDYSVYRYGGKSFIGETEKRLKTAKVNKDEELNYNYYSKIKNLYFSILTSKNSETNIIIPDAHYDLVDEEVLFSVAFLNQLNSRINGEKAIPKLENKLTWLQNIIK